MSEISKAAVLEAIDAAGLDRDTALREGYSGRFMYGEPTFGIVGSINEYTAFTVEFAKAEGGDGGDAQELAMSVRSDDMGRQEIFYFPGCELVEEDEEDEED